MAAYGNNDEGATRILLVEDSPTDVRLIEEALKDVRGRRYETFSAPRLSEGLRRLEEGGIDVVLLDLSLPDSTPENTFPRLHAQAGNIPVIVLTGLDDESMALELIGKGAQDYVLKDQLSSRLLSNSIHYAIERKCLHRQLEETIRKLQTSRTSFHNIVENSPYGILVVDRNGGVLYMNTAAKNLFGSNGEDLATELLRSRLAEGTSADVNILRREGGARVAEMHIVETPWQEGQIAFLVTLRDVTDRKHFEGELFKLASLAAEGKLASVLTIAKEGEDILASVRPQGK